MFEQSVTATSARRSRPRIFALVLLLIGIALLLPGIRLATLGGSPYYALAGLAITLSGALLWRGDSRAVSVYAATFAATLLWSLYESGLDAWALLPRLAFLAVVGLWFFTPSLRRKLAPRHSRVSLAVLGISIGIAAALIAIGLLPATGALPRSAPGLPQSPVSGDWMHYGNDPGGSRFSPLAQITSDNVKSLELAWTYRTGISATSVKTALEVTPLKIGDSIYLCTGLDDVVALDPETGKQRWRFDAKLNSAGLFSSVCRGVAYFRAPAAPSPSPTFCEERILVATTDARMIAVNARTGERCPEFGRNGEIDLTVGMGEVTKGYYTVTSAPQIVRGKAVVGGNVIDGQETGEPSGVVRAFDAVTGQLAWAWDMGRPGEHTAPGPGEQYTRGTPNSWAPMSADEALGLVYVPTGNATPDYYAGYRTPTDDRYSSSVVAIDADTGEPRWSFQTTHHDMWDYDVASQPVLFDMPTPTGAVPALVQATKRGELFVLDRRSGKPLVDVIERPVPASRIPEEHASKTQPFSSGFPSFAGPQPSEARMWGLTPFDQLWCRIAFRKARFEGTMTPLGIDQPSIVFPGFLGGFDWGSVTVDQERGLLIANANRVPNYDRMLTRAEADRRGLKPLTPQHPDFVGGAVAQAGTPYGADIAPFLSPLVVPCTQPPYGTISAVDIGTHKIRWEKPFGMASGSGPLTLHSHLPLTMGVPNIGGPVATRGGVFFIAASQDSYFRAFDTGSGKELWRYQLPAGGQATPMSYWSNDSGRQFVLIAVGGHGGLLTPPGDYIMAFALPQPKHAR
jgi:quinoprotein glucose dehydrogenase